MLEKSEIRSLIVGAWREAGLTGRGRRWAYSGAEVQWEVAYEGDWLGRISMVADARFTDGAADEYPLRIFADFLPNVDGDRLTMALQAETRRLTDDERRDVVQDSARALADFVMAHDTMDGLREAYRTGSLDSMSIRKDLRESLEQA